MVPKKTGLQLIIDERMEQIDKHGYGPENDDDHVQGELLDLASFCLGNHVSFPKMFPVAKRKILGKTLTERLTIAGALIAAEIDRLLRAQERANTESPTTMTCQGKDSAKCVGPRCAHYPDKHEQDEYCMTPGICGYSCFRVFRIEEDKPITKQVVCPLGEHCVVGVCSHKEKHDVKDGCFEGTKLCPGCVPVTSK